MRFDIVAEINCFSREFVGGLQLEQLQKNWLQRHVAMKEGLNWPRHCYRILLKILEEMKDYLGASAIIINQWTLLKRIFAAGKGHASH